jgi:hypothetical protein
MSMRRRFITTLIARRGSNGKKLVSRKLLKNRANFGVVSTPCPCLFSSLEAVSFGL